MCEAFNVSRSAFYDWFSRPRTKREEQDLLLSQEIKGIFEESDSTYGHLAIAASRNNCGKKELNAVTIVSVGS